MFAVLQSHLCLQKESGIEKLALNYCCHVKLIIKYVSIEFFLLQHYFN